MSALVLLDVGRGIGRGYQEENNTIYATDGARPFSSVASVPSHSINSGAFRPDDANNIEFYPIIQFEPRMWRFGGETSDRKKFSEDHHKGKDSASVHRGYKEAVSTKGPWQSASLLTSIDYGRFLDPELMKIDAFYALHDLFSFCAKADNQVLNVSMKGAIEIEPKSYFDEESLEIALSTLRSNKAMWRKKLEQIQCTADCIKSWDRKLWPSVEFCTPETLRNSFTSVTYHWESSPTLPPDNLPAAFTNVEIREKLKIEADFKTASLLRDYEGLSKRAQTLLQVYSEAMEEIRTNIALLEARKSLREAYSIGRLTKLAFFFLPLSFTCSIFGMNFREIGESLSIWIWVAVSIPVLLCSLALSFWPRMYNDCKRIFFKWK